MLYEVITKSDRLMQIQESGTDIRLPSGQLVQEELLAILNTLPVDITFVDRNDRNNFV